MIPPTHRARRLLTLIVAAAASAAVAAVPADNRPGAHDARPSTAVRAPVLAPGVTVGHIEHRGIGHHIVEVDLGRIQLDLVGQTAGPSAVRSFAALDAWLADSGRQLVMATNAGLFHVDHRPVGLHVERGVAHTAVERSVAGRGNFWMQPNGVFSVDRGRARIEATPDWPPPAFAERAPRIAVQSGPLLLHRGAVHPAFAPDSEHRRIRNAVGVRDARTVVFALSAGPVRFHDLATLFRDRLGCADALYLDGGISGLLAPGVTLAQTARHQTFAGFFTISRPTP